ncbi:HAD family hydrolase [Phyllobacterium myrsinacearum]|uniref:HAD family hydrolase n=1 Tax=Phyllobacterium myrsinacearum TaxID=28101 RepID=UPI0015FDA08B|nr:HAD family hydrolase [Phyllobacterium myrsinacearum]
MVLPIKRKCKLSPVTSPVFSKPFSALLFDMDGTLLNSLAAAERVWGDWARSKGLDVEAFLPTMHGVRGVDTIRRLGLPGVDPEAESAMIEQAEIDDVEGIVAIPGAVAFLKSLPAESWAIVTSAPIVLAKRRLEAAGIPLPRIMVTAEDVSIGKPDPECYLLGARKLGVDIADCLVFEDAPAGIQAGEAAGAEVLVITATQMHTVATHHTAIANYDEIAADIGTDGTISIVRT